MFSCNWKALRANLECFVMISRQKELCTSYVYCVHIVALQGRSKARSISNSGRGHLLAISQNAQSNAAAQ